MFYLTLPIIIFFYYYVEVVPWVSIMFFFIMLKLFTIFWVSVENNINCTKLIFNPACEECAIFKIRKS